MQATGKRVGGLVLLVTFLTISTASGAFAHRIYDGWVAVWTSGPKCVNEKVTTDHGQYGSGFFGVEGNAEKETVTAWGTISCSQSWVRPANWLRVYLAIKYKPTLNGAVSGCWASGWYYSHSTTDYLKYTKWPLGTTPLCGAGYYQAHGNVHMSLDGSWADGHWVGGAVLNTEWHYVPTTASPNPF